ncbi:hypothetical protein GCM10010424_69300 [Streptomyces lienomycini]
MRAADRQAPAVVPVPSFLLDNHGPVDLQLTPKPVDKRCPQQSTKPAGGIREYTYNKDTPTCGGFEGQRCTAKDGNGKVTPSPTTTRAT